MSCVCAQHAQAAMQPKSSTCCCFLQVSTQLYVHAAGNPLLNYLKGLEADSVKSLTIVSDDALEAINTFIHRLLGEHVFVIDMHSRALTGCNLLSGLVAK